MDRCKQRNIRLNLDKIKLGLESVSYLETSFQRMDFVHTRVKYRRTERCLPVRTVEQCTVRNGKFYAEIFQKPFRKYVYPSGFIEE